MRDSLLDRLVAVDRLTVEVLVDNTTDSLSSLPAGVTNEVPVLLGNGSLTRARGEQRCVAQHGLSLAITTHAAGASRTVLFDAGPDAEGVLRNAALMRTALHEVSAVVLSHGHWDHAGGLHGVISRVAELRGDDGVECHLNPDMLVERATRRPGSSPLPQEPVPAPQLLADAGARVVNDRAARLVAGDHFYLSGEIPRVTSYERGFPAQLRRAGDGWEADPWIRDERYLAVRVADLGVVVFTACSHAGVVNVLTDAQEKFGGIALHTVMGGFHLSGEAVEATIDDSVADLRRFGLRRVIPGHCTGWRALHALAKVYPDDVLIPSAVGRVFTFPF